MKLIKGVICGMWNVLFNEDEMTTTEHTEEVLKLFRYFEKKQIKVVVLANRPVVYKESRKSFRDMIKEKCPHADVIIANEDGTPQKPTAEAADYVLTKYKWEKKQVVYLGNSEEDMRTAINGGLLFLNGIWHGENTKYGVKFATPRDVARFIDVFCHREHLWHYHIDRPDLQFRAICPYAWIDAETKPYSLSARAAAKDGSADIDFWMKYLFSTIYLSDLHREVKYIAVYPGHEEGFGNPKMDEALYAFGQNLGRKYLRDLIVRHTTVPSSHGNRSACNHKRQIESIHLNKLPIKFENGKRYKNPVPIRGQSVLVIDDFCTEGFSFEAARVLLHNAGATAVSVSWLKTIFKDYQAIDDIPKITPWKPIKLTQPPRFRYLPYRGHIIDAKAQTELSTQHKAYSSWTWKE